MAVRTWGMSVCLIKDILSVPDGICGSTTWDNLPISLLVLPDQSYFLEPTMRWWYSSEAPVSGLMKSRSNDGEGETVGDGAVWLHMENRAT